jgi:hypothetical protein
MKKPKKRIFSKSGGLVFILMVIFMAAGSVPAADKYWAGFSSDWIEDSNWADGERPAWGDSVFIWNTTDPDPAIAGAVNFNDPGNPKLKYLQIDNPDLVDDDTTLYQNSLVITTELTEVGVKKGVSVFDQRGGKHQVIGGGLHLGVEPDSSGFYALIDAILSVGGHEKIGLGGQGNFSQENGLVLPDGSPNLQCTPNNPPINPPPVTPPPIEPVHTVGKNLYLGYLEGSHGQFNIEAGSLTVGGSIRVANSGTGMFNHANSRVTVKGNDPDPLENSLQALAGDEFSNLRRKRVTAPSLECHSTSKNPGLIVGLNNFGTYSLTGGTLNVNYSEIIGWGAGSRHYYYNEETKEVDWGYSASFTQSFGSHKVSGNFIVAKHDDLTEYPVLPTSIYYTYPNYYSLNGASIYGQNVPSGAEKGLLDVGGFSSVGYLGYGAIYQDGGAIKVRGIDPALTNLGLRTAYSSESPTLQCHTNQRQYIGLTVGRGGTGEYYLSNGELLVSRGEAIGVFGGSDGAFYHTSGSHYVGGALTIALLPDSKGFYQFLDGLLVARGGLVNNGTFEMYGGDVQAKVTNNGNFLVKKPAFPQPEQTNPAIVGDFYNRENATLAVNGATVKFDKQVYNNGYLEILGDAAVTFKHLTINPAGYLTAGVVDPSTLTIIGEVINDPNIPAVVTITGNLVNKSTKPLEWNMDSATLAFSGSGTHFFKTGNDASGDWESNFGWGAPFSGFRAIYMPRRSTWRQTETESRTCSGTAASKSSTTQPPAGSQRWPERNYIAPGADRSVILITPVFLSRIAFNLLTGLV